MRIVFFLVPLVLAGGSVATAKELVPLRVELRPGQPEVRQARYSDRTVTVAVNVDRDAVSLIGYTVKDRPFIRPLPQSGEALAQRNDGAHLDVVLVRGNGDTYTQRVDTPWICFSHDASSPPHISGDTIVLHRDAVLVELPEIAGIDRIEFAIAELSSAAPMHVPVGSVHLDRSHFNPAGGPATYADLAFADPADTGQPAALTTGMVYWPEDFGDHNIYKVYGDASESDRRISVTIVPDGYTYSEKDLMTTHAEELVAAFRNKTPYMEHDPFINYTLVYAYSAESGTDQCDCGITRDTAMGTGFNPAGDPCGGSANRCLYFSTCGGASLLNIVTAELRAPATNTTIIMVNTTRYGGCGGNRAVYSAANSSAVEVGLHELGHSLAGLADEYVSYAGCGTSVGGINTSADPTNGAWPEWIADLGPPREGAQYYTQCIYRPFDNCIMRSLYQPFCAVCNQWWALTILGNSRVSPTAPIKSSYPPSAPSACVDVPATFSVDTRLPFPSAGNTINWTLTGPGFPVGTQVATGVSSHTRTFAQAGSYVLASEVIADTAFIKPALYGVNRRTVSWNVGVFSAAGDADGDGCGSANDCNNSNVAVYPGAPQVCDGLNNDCNASGWPAKGGTNEGDDDGDSFSECQGDCDDQRAAVRPGAPQICDGLNNDCGDASWPSVPSVERDLDGDGVSPCQGDCDEAHASVHPLGLQICGDGLNNDCNDPSWPASVTTELDDDGDGLSECQGDCDDIHASVRPLGPQICGDGLNNDCLAPGWPSVAGTNDADNDLDGFKACTGDCDDGDPDTYPGAAEVNDAQDNQCPGDPGHGVADEVSGVAGFPDRTDTASYCWPLQSGATGYKVVRSSSSAFSTCVDFTVGAVNCIVDATQPPVGGILYYLVRADAPFAGSWGQNSAGNERAGACLPICGNGVRESLEFCDGQDLGGETCVSQGFESGKLGCNTSCSGYDYSACRF